MSTQPQGPKRRMERHHKRNTVLLEKRQRSPSTGLGAGGNDTPNEPPTTGDDTGDDSGTFVPSPGSNGLGGDDEDTTTTSASRMATSTTRTLPTTTRTTARAETTTAKNIIDSILEGLTETSTSSTSSSTSTTSSSTSTRTTSSTTSSSTSTTPTTTSTYAPVTAVSLVTSSPTQSVAPIASETAKPKDDGPGAGPIIGIVAGALAGIVLVSGLIGFLFKKYKNKSDPFEANPFATRDDFRRHSTMIPDHFDDDDGHGSPEMSEHHNYGPSYESGVAAGAGAAAMLAHNEGGPRPPTMFARHVNAPAAQYDQQMYNAPQVGGYYNPGHNGEYSMANGGNSPQSMEYVAPVATFGNRHLDEPMQNQRSVSPAPQLPLAAFGGDPYSIAGIGARMNNNIANPYAYLDRGHSMNQQHQMQQPRDSSSTSSHGAPFDSHNSAAADALVAGLAHQSHLQSQRSPSPAVSNTAGRPGTAEGRSGTPDLPNVQQTYAIGGSGSDDGHVVATSRMSQSSQDMLRTSAMSPPVSTNGGLDPFSSPKDEAPLSVRNLMPPQGAQQQQQRPISTASSFADPEDAYGGVY